MQEAPLGTRSIYVKSVGAWRRLVRLGFVHAACPDACEELGQPVGLRMDKKLADHGDIALGQTMKLLSGIRKASFKLPVAKCEAAGLTGQITAHTCLNINA